MINPVILFVPVSSDKGVGEYTRSAIIADAVQEQFPKAEIHFILNRNMKLAESCPYQTHLSDHSATKNTPLVNGVISKIKPDLVIFDCAGRAKQFAHAKRSGAKVIFISQHHKKRARGLSLRRLLFCDLQWVVQPDFAIQPLSIIEKLKIKLSKKQPPKNIGPIIPEPVATQDVLQKYDLIPNQFILLSAGSGGHEINGELSADIFYQAALALQRTTDLKVVMVFGPHYGKKLPEKSDVLCLSYLSINDFIVLLKESKTRILSAGSTLLQVIELKIPSVAVAVSKDQPIRLEKCANEGIVLDSECKVESILHQINQLLDEEISRKMKEKLEQMKPTGGLREVLSDIGKILGESSENPCSAITLIQENPNIKKAERKYLFFISQDYSFPVLRPIQKEILARGDQVSWFLYGKQVHHNYLHSKEHKVDTIQEIKSYEPDAVFVPGNVVPSFIPGLKVQVFHGLPSTKAKRNGELYHYIIREMFDLYCTQGPESTKKFNTLKRKYRNFQVAETGWSKLDPLFDNRNLKSVRSKKTIFFASTFSPRFSKADILYPKLIKMMKKYDFFWYITLHPKMNKSTLKQFKEIDLPNVKFIDSTELVDGFRNADLMLCDTSSIIYEFLTQRKPVITFQTEKDKPYLININDINQLENTILTVLKNPAINSNNIFESVAKFHPYDDGFASQRILDYVELMLSGKNLPDKYKPINFLRNFKLRKELGYWDFF